MPHVHDGIGTWYYGKRRIHRIKGTCEFCNNVGELESYDTTLFIVVFFVPLIPLGQKRILNSCPYCKKHRLLPLHLWETTKAQQAREVLEQLKANPDDGSAIRNALAMATGFQDEELFNKLATSLAHDRPDDADVQAQLAAGYSYFSRYHEAEKAYRASLATRQEPSTQYQLGMVLLKQGRPEEACPLLMPILDTADGPNAPLIFYLVEGLQTKGLHRQALEIMDLRDETFPELAQEKLCRKQRQVSTRHKDSGKSIKSTYLSESKKIGTQEGGWGSSLARWIGPVLGLVFLVWYLGTAIWLGAHRPVFLVNGTDLPYTVSINGKEQTLNPGQTKISVPEGLVKIDFRDPLAHLEPVSCEVKTQFLGRPFWYPTLIINPDRLAFVSHQTVTYAEIAPPVNPPQIRTGESFYHYDGVHCEFTELPTQVSVKRGQSATRTRVSLLPVPSAEDRLLEMTTLLAPNQQIDYARRWLQFDPDNVFFLNWFVRTLPIEQALAFLDPQLSVRPIQVENHRLYQHLMEKAHPEKDLRPTYEKLVIETNRQPNALYLLARLREGLESDQLLREAIKAEKPTVYPVHSLGWRALSRGDFTESIRLLEQALKLSPKNTQVRQDLFTALKADGQFDRLLKELGYQIVSPINQLNRQVEYLRVHAMRGDKVKTQNQLNQCLALLPPSTQPHIRKMLFNQLTMIICCGNGDIAGYLAAITQDPNGSLFEPALLRDNLVEAAKFVEDPQDESRTQSQIALLYLAARKARNDRLADQQWNLLLENLNRSGRPEKHLGEILTGTRPIDAATVQNLPIDPKQKRILLLVVSQRFPETAKTLLPLARKLDFHFDSQSLCLAKIRGD